MYDHFIEQVEFNHQQELQANSVQIQRLQQCLEQSAGQNQLLVSNIGKSQKKETKLNQEIESLQVKYEKQIAHFKDNMENQRSQMNNVAKGGVTSYCANCAEQKSDSSLKEKPFHPADFTGEEDFDLDGPIRDEHVRVKASR